MATFVITPPNAVDIRKAGIVHDYLEANGVDVQGVSITVRPDQSIRYVIEANDDPTALIAQFVPPINTDAQARAALLALKAKLEARAASTDDLHTAILALMELNGF